MRTRFVLPLVVAMGSILGCAFLAPMSGCSRGGNAGPAPVLPMSVFFMGEDKISFRLSPDGEWVAYLARWQSRYNLFVQQIGSDAAQRLTESSERDIIGIGWLDNDRLIYFRDSDGAENYHLFVVNSDGSDRRDLTPFDGVGAYPIDLRPTSDGKILAAMNRDDPRRMDAYRVDLATGELELIAENHLAFREWVTDHDGRLRAAIRDTGGKSSLYWRRTEDEPFHLVVETDVLNAITPVAFTFDNRHLYVLSRNGKDKQGLWIYDPEANEHLELLFDHPESDVRDVLLSRKKRSVEGVTYILDRYEDHFFDPERERLQTTVESLIPEPVVNIYDRSEDETRFVARGYSDRTMGAYYFYDAATGELDRLVEISPWLNGEPLADMEPVSIRARDGLELKGFLTLPVGVAPKNLPAVIWVHHGHWNRIYWQWNGEIQFLANRGYAVLALNYRGSVSMGARFAEAGFRQWGRAMQDDLSDGVAWLIERGIADPQRIGIMGYSYGGYAALAGLAFTPELYACGVSVGGMNDIMTFLDELPPYAEAILGSLHDTIGNPETDSAYLDAVSPLLHVDRIEDPALLVQGARDPWVSQASTDSFVAALRSRDQVVEYLVFEDETHYISGVQNIYSMYRAVEEFLGLHLGGRVEEVAQLARSENDRD